jgi:hypothetical protein
MPSLKVRPCFNTSLFVKKNIGAVFHVLVKSDIDTRAKQMTHQKRDGDKLFQVRLNWVS